MNSSNSQAFIASSAVSPPGSMETNSSRRPSRTSRSSGISSAWIASINGSGAEVVASLPKGLTLTPFYDQTEVIDRTSATVKKNLEINNKVVGTDWQNLIRNVRAHLDAHGFPMIEVRPARAAEVFQATRPETSMGFAPGSRYQSSDEKRPLQTPGMRLPAPLQ